MSDTFPQQPAQEDAGSESIRPPSDERDDYFALDEQEEGPHDDLFEPAYGGSGPYQGSAAYPALNAAATGALPNAPTTAKKRRRMRLPLLIGGVSVVVVLLLVVALTVFAAQTPPQTTGTAPVRPTTVPAKTQPVLKIQGAPTVTPTAKATVEASGQPGQAATWLPQSLPAGWTTAGLLTPDAVETERTALAFTDREEELDFRNVGTRAVHAGTMTAATFILTPSAKVRFRLNDVRVIDNVLFDRIAQQQLIQAAVDVTPKLVQFQVQGNQQFVWVDVSFHLWQSRIDPNNTQQRIESFDLDPVTKQVRVHHMLVLLLRVPPAVQGPAAPMGGTGWLVSTYALDQAGLPALVQPA